MRPLRPETARRGRHRAPRIYCSPACRKAAYEDRRAHRPAAAKAQLVDRVVVQTIEKTIRIGAKKITPANEVFWDLVTSADYLREALARAADRHQ